MFPEINFGSFAKRFDRLNSNPSTPLVHYTSASTLFRILEDKVVWMRNARCMNDFKEMTYAFELIAGYFSKKKHRERFREACDGCFEGAYQEIGDLITGHSPNIQGDAYITCLSEHSKFENNGRLSMWRGYGGRDLAVAIYLNTKETLQEGPYGIEGYPVEYWDMTRFSTEMNARVRYIAANRDKIVAGGRQPFIDGLFHMFYIFAVALKHPAFREEKEWRLVYLPKLYPSAGMEEHRKTKVVNGMPQVIYEIPIDGKPINNGIALTPRQLVHRIVVGPCSEADVAVSAIEEALRRAMQHPRPSNKQLVTFCGIPYREKI